MNEPIRIALIKASNPKDFDACRLLLNRPGYWVRLVHDEKEILSAVREDGDDFDAIVVTLRDLAGSQGLNLCQALRAQRRLSTIPIVGLLFDLDPQILPNMPEYSPDILIAEPFDSDLTFAQLQAAARLHRSTDTALHDAFESAGLRQSSLAALNASYTALCVFDADGNLTFMNDGASLLLGITMQAEPAARAAAAAQLAQILPRTHSEPSDFRDLSFLRADGQSVRLVCQVRTLQSTRSQRTLGYTIGIIEEEPCLRAEVLLRLARRIRSVTMQIGAYAMRDPALQVDPHGAVQSALSAEPAHCLADDTIGHLLEYLDFGLPASIAVRLELDHGIELAINRSTLFQALGIMILSAVDHCGGSGKLHIELRRQRTTAQLTLEAEPLPFVQRLPHPLLQRLLRTEDDSLTTAAGDMFRTSGGKVAHVAQPNGEWQLSVTLPLYAPPNSGDLQ